MQDYLLQNVFQIYNILLAGMFFFLLELVRPARKGKFFKNEFSVDISIALLNIFIFSHIAYVLAYILLEAPLNVVLPPQIFDETIQSWPTTVQILFALLISDISTYWRHRATHTIRYLWVWHAVHHSIKEISWISGLRLHPIDLTVAILCDATIMYIAGFSGPNIAIAGIIYYGYNYFTHANLDLDYPAPLKYILASPNFHRWHHETSEPARNKNFCGMFSALDYIHGTYYYPIQKKPSHYGLSPKLQQAYGTTLISQLWAPFRAFMKLKPKP